MARVKGAMMTRKRRNKTLKLAKSYWGSKYRHFKMAKQAVAKSGVYAYVGRKLKKREFRQLWISRISAAAKWHTPRSASSCSSSLALTVMKLPLWPRAQSSRDATCPCSSAPKIPNNLRKSKTRKENHYA